MGELEGVAGVEFVGDVIVHCGLDGIGNEHRDDVRACGGLDGRCDVETVLVDGVARARILSETHDHVDPAVGEVLRVGVAL